MHAFERVSSFGPGGKQTNPLVKIVQSSSLATSPSADRLWLSSGIVGLDSMYAEPFEEADEGLMDHAVKE